MCIAAGLLNLAACGGGAGAGTDERAGSPPARSAAEFAGTWMFLSGSEVTIACPGMAPVVASLASTSLELALSDDGALRGTSSLGCKYAYSIEGRSALLLPGQTCEIPDGRGGMTTERLERDILTLHDTHTLSLEAKGTMGPGGACALTVTGSLAR